MKLQAASSEYMENDEMNSINIPNTKVTILKNSYNAITIPASTSHIANKLALHSNYLVY